MNGAPTVITMITIIPNASHYDWIMIDGGSDGTV